MFQLITINLNIPNVLTPSFFLLPFAVGLTYTSREAQADVFERAPSTHS